MGSARSSRWTDEQLAAIFNETADWVVNGRQGKVLCHAASLRLAIDRAADYAVSGAVVIAVCRLPSDNIIVFPAQVARLRKLMVGPELLIRLVEPPDDDLIRRDYLQ